jgi:tetratricopeptide (TPR) repeat protein
MIARIDRNIQSGKWSCKKSAEMLSDIIGFDHTIYNAYFQRARLYIQIHDYQKAISDDSLLLDRNEHLWSDCLLDRAECFFQLGRLHEALHDLDRYAFHRVPDKNKVYLELRHKTEEALAKI